MSMRVRALSMAAVLVAAMWNLGCGHYVCKTTFGASTCTATPPAIGGGGTGGGGTPTAFAFAGLLSPAGIQSFTFSATAPSFLATPNFTTASAPTSGGGSLIVVQGKYLYGTFPGTGLYNQIYGWTISAKGDLASISGSPFTVATWTGTNLGTFATNPSGSLLFMTDAGTPFTVHSFQVGSGGGLTEASGSPLLVPFAPGAMAMDGLGKYLYVLPVLGLTPGLGSPVIGAYSVSSTGGLTPVPGSAFAFPMTQVAGDASGNYLVGTTGNPSGDAHLYVFNIQQSGTTAGALTPVAGSPFVTLFSPIGIAVQPTGGEFVYSFSVNQSGVNPIEGYQLNATTGALTVVSGSPFSFGAELGQFDQSGTYMFGRFGDHLTGLKVSTSGALASVASIDEAWMTQIAITDVP